MFARILIHLYRYFLRLAAYYEARADGIALATQDGKKIYDKLPEKLPELFDALSPDGVDLGKPNSPVNDITESAIKIAKASAELAGKLKSTKG